MSDHIDSPSALENGRLDLCDMYAFGGVEPGTWVLIFAVNPDAGRSSARTFHPEALYEIKLDTDGDAVEDVARRVTFGGVDHLAGFPYLAPPKDLSPGLPPLVPREAG